VKGGSKMKLPHRRKFLHLAAGAAALPTISRVARAQAYPARPVHLIVGAPPGGAADIVARLMSQWLSERFGRPFVIDNRPGAATNIGTEAVVKAVPDGYTLLFVTSINASNAALYDNLNFNFIRDIAPVASIDRLPFVMEVNPSVPAKTVPEFIAYARVNPGKINMASVGNGSIPHLSGELFKMMTGVNMVHVPYRGEAPALTDLLGGQVQLYFGTLPGSIEYIKVGKLRALAVTTATRSEALPDVPTLSEFVPNYEASGWHGIGVPKNTPTEIVDKLNKEINAALGGSSRGWAGPSAAVCGSILVGLPPTWIECRQRRKNWSAFSRMSCCQPRPRRRPHLRTKPKRFPSYSSSSPIRSAPASLRCCHGPAGISPASAGWRGPSPAFGWNCSRR
jgi:tripartite-type tricarboxylate transporter receptor subunit TctC